jgi:dienelactone hydrolase
MRIPRILTALGCFLSLCGFTSNNVTFDGVSVLPEIKPIKVSGRLSKPDGDEKRPALLLLVTCGGADDTINRVWPQYLAELGYVTLVVDYVRSRSQQSCGKPTSLLAPQPRQQIVGDIYGGVQYLSKLPYIDSARIGSLGFSMGAIMNTYISNRDFKTQDGVGIKVFVNFYGHCSKGSAENATYQGPKPTLPWLMVDGTKETPAFIKSCEPLKGYPNVEYHLLDGAYHGWDQESLRKITFDDAGTQMLYSQEATKQSREILKAWLAKNL